MRSLYQDVKTGREGIIEVKSIKEITPGCTTAVFGRYKKVQKEKSDLCISFIAPTRTLDIELESKDQRGIQLDCKRLFDRYVDYLVWKAVKKMRSWIINGVQKFFIAYYMKY